MFLSQSSDHHQGSITVLVRLLLIGMHASSYSGMWLYAVCASVHTMCLSVWCLVMYITRHHTDVCCLCVCAYDVPVRVVSDYVHNQTPHGCMLSVHTMCLSVWCLVMYITRHHTDRHIVCTDAQTTYSHIPEYDEACTPISSNCTSTVIDP